MKTNISKSLLPLAAVITLVSTAIPVQAQSYYLAGPYNGWNNNANQMSGGPAVYNYTVTNGTPGAYTQFKVTDGTWNNTWPGGNMTVGYNANSNITVNFMPGTFIDGWTPLQNRVGYADPGTPWEMTGDFTSPAWGSDPAAQLTLVSNGIYSVTYIIPTAGTHAFQFRTSGTWSDSQIGSDFAGSANASVTTTGAMQSVQFQLDLPNGRWVAGTPAVVVTNQVVFVVDMSVAELLGQFNPATDTAFASGSFNNWPGISTNALALTNFPAWNGNTNLYYGTNTIISLAASGYEYKFTANDPVLSGNAYYEQISQNRSFSLLSSSGVLILPTAIFGGGSLADYLPADTTVTFTVNMTNAVTYTNGTSLTTAHTFDPANDYVFINGNFISGGWTAWNPIALSQMQNNPPGSQIYQFTYTVPKGSPVLLDYKYGMFYQGITNSEDNEAASGNDHFRYVRITSTGSYTLPTDTFGNQYSEPNFGQLKAASATAGTVAVTWLGRPGVHLQANSNLLSTNWQDIWATDGTNWVNGYNSTNGFVSQTNWPSAGSTFFRLIQPQP